MFRDKKFFLLVIGLVVAVALILQFTRRPAAKTVYLNGQPIIAEIAADPASRERGLSGRVSLAAGEGMLFLFGRPNRYVFWMIDMRFPLDIIWLRDGLVVDMVKGALPPEPGTPVKDLPRYTPRLPADAVLEVNSGLADEAGLKIGDQIKGL